MKPRLLEALAEADKSFAETGDGLEALEWVAFAAKAGLPLPPHIGKWLCDGLLRYRAATEGSLDMALGLVKSGAGDLRRRVRGRRDKQEDMAKMMVLHMLGATIPQAAAMVERLRPGLTTSTLADRYRRSGLGKRALLGRGHPWRRVEIERMLAEYPDHSIEIAQGKAAIRAMYSKGRT